MPTYRGARPFLKPDDAWATAYERSILAQRHGANPICCHNHQQTKANADSEQAAGIARCLQRQLDEWAAENPPTPA